MSAGLGVTGQLHGRDSIICGICCCLRLVDTVGASCYGVRVSLSVCTENLVEIS